MLLFCLLRLWKFAERDIERGEIAHGMRRKTGQFAYIE